MSGIESAFETLRRDSWQSPDPALMSLEAYVVHGGDANRRAIRHYQPPKSYQSTGTAKFVAFIARPRLAGEADFRALEGLLLAGFNRDVGAWADHCLRTEGPKEDTHAVLMRVLRAAGREEDRLELLGSNVETWARGRVPTSAGRALLAMSDDELRQLTGFAAQWHPVELTAFLLESAPARLGTLLDLLLGKNTWRAAEVCSLLAAKSGRTHEGAIVDAMRAAKEPRLRFEIGRVLHSLEPVAHREKALEAALKCRADSALWLLEVLGPDSVPHLTHVVTSTRENNWAWRSSCEEILAAAVRTLGKGALSLLQAGAKSTDQALAFAGLNHLAILAHPSTAGFVRKNILQGLAHKDPAIVARFADLAGRASPADYSAELWALMGHASRPVRASATRALVRMKEGARTRALEALSDRKAEVRLGAAEILSALGGAEEALEARLEAESSDLVRDALLEALERAHSSAGRAPTRADVEALIARAEPKLRRPRPPGFEPEKLPALRFLDGAPLDERAVRYLLYRQARCAEIRPDIECRALYALIDRRTSGDFAAAVLNAFIRSDARTSDRWALAVAGILGDRRSVAELARLAAEWADTARNALAMAAVAALALQGSDEAMLALDALAIRYRARRKIVSDAAREAIARAADAMGVSPDDLGDRVVPWLGFEQGKPRIVPAGGKELQVEVTPLFKLRFREVASRKILSAVPKSASPEQAKELKELAAALREAGKSQGRRMESLFVRQRRWPEPRWRELFLAHPLLAPFAVRQIWGAWTEQGALSCTFRALEDLSLTDAADAAVAVPPGCRIGLVHPLDLGEPALAAWRAHLADHEVEPAFEQMERPVARPAASQRNRCEYDGVSGKSVLGITFRGRMDRLAWRHGSVQSHGYVSCFLKPFPESGVDGLLRVEGMYMGIGMEASVTLGPLQFVKSGSVRTASGEYDEPSGPDDPRLVRLGDVPAVVYSETVSDLAEIAGAADPEE